MNCPNCKTRMIERHPLINSQFDSKGLIEKPKIYYECSRCRGKASVEERGFCFTIVNGFWFMYNGNSWNQHSKVIGGFVFR